MQSLAQQQRHVMICIIWLIIALLIARAVDLVDCVVISVSRTVSGAMIISVIRTNAIPNSLLLVGQRWAIRSLTAAAFCKRTIVDIVVILGFDAALRKAAERTF